MGLDPAKRAKLSYLQKEMDSLSSKKSISYGELLGIMGDIKVVTEGEKNTPVMADLNRIAITFLNTCREKGIGKVGKEGRITLDDDLQLEILDLSLAVDDVATAYLQGSGKEGVAGLEAYKSGKENAGEAAAGEDSAEWEVVEAPSSPELLVASFNDALVVGDKKRAAEFFGQIETKAKQDKMRVLSAGIRAVNDSIRRPLSREVIQQCSTDKEGLAREELPPALESELTEIFDGMSRGTQTANGDLEQAAPKISQGFFSWSESSRVRAQSKQELKLIVEMKGATRRIWNCKIKLAALESKKSESLREHGQGMRHNLDVVSIETQKRKFLGDLMSAQTDFRDKTKKLQAL